MSDWSKDIDLEVIKEYLQECAENDDYHYEQYQVDIVMHEYIRQKLVIEKLDKEIERLNNIVNGINNYCFKRMAELDDIRERDKKLEDFCENKINAFLEVREKIKELERSDEE